MAEARVSNTLRKARMRQPQVDVPSPCVSVCQMDPATGWCQGCWRTLDEITDWAVLEADEKLAIWRVVEQRQTLPTPPTAHRCA
jgi:uncharacterized protein